VHVRRVVASNLSVNLHFQERGLNAPDYMKKQIRQLGGLSCRLIDDLPETEEPQWIVVLCHGFGAPGTDLVPVGPELLNLKPTLAKQIQFVFPAAPLSLDDFGMPGGRAWWPLDVERVLGAIEQGDLDILRRMHPEGLMTAAKTLGTLVEEVRAQTGLPMSRIVVGGFSQGAMVATELALKLDEKPAALCLWSGSLLCEEVWRPLAPSLKETRILQSHGRHDPILPFQGAVWLREMLADAGNDVDFIDFQGVHTIPFEALQQFADLLEGLGSE
jgi:phospholipase/carboxylesterase